MEQSNPSKDRTTDNIPTMVAVPSLGHSLGFQNSISGELPVLLTDIASRGMIITTPRI
jgi:hypothetical protein